MIKYYKCEGCSFIKSYDESKDSDCIHVCLKCNKKMSRSSNRPPFLTYNKINLFKANGVCSFLLLEVQGIHLIIVSPTYFLSHIYK